MFLRRKGQSTAEYAILIGLVIAVAAGVLQVALKRGLGSKSQQAFDVLGKAGTTSGGELQLSNDASNIGLYSQEYRQTTVAAGADYADESVMKKGGAEEKYQKQTTTTEAVSVEALDQAAELGK